MTLHHQGQVPLPSFCQQLATIEDFFHQGEFLLTRAHKYQRLEKTTLVLAPIAQDKILQLDFDHL